ncbi:MAG TPA: MFS transporter, partial [Arthrobacter sp.]|nr:MFS transporter [Arthrobacter sp.]
GAVLMGILTYFVPALQNAGIGVTLAGVLAAGYGIGVILGARLMRRLVRHFTRTQLMASGGLVLVIAYLASSLSQLPAALTATALLVGASNAMLHSSMQGWATDVAPQARATSVSLFAFSLFLGSSLGTFLTAGLADERQYGTIFSLGLIVSIILTTAACWGHAIWKRKQP